MRTSPRQPYSKNFDATLHRDIIDHPAHLDATNGDELRSMDFVFVYREKNPPKEMIIEELEERVRKTSAKRPDC